jgi:hypothetical protein
MEEPDDNKISLDQGHSYFLYIGEIKAAGLNSLLVRLMSDRYGKPARCIHIVPDVLASYPDENYLVVNQTAIELGRKNGSLVNVRPQADQFAREVSEDARVLRIMKQILAFQDDLFINMFETRKELKLAAMDRVHLLGPDPGLAERINSKLEQYRLAAELGVRVPEGKICGSMDEAVIFAEPLIARDGRVFISAEFSSAGSNSIIAASMEQIRNKFGDSPGGLLVTRFVEHDLDPTVLGVVVAPGQVYIASVADQNINGTRFQGSAFPTAVGEEKAGELVGMTRRIGEYLAAEGYRGAFGCDYMIDTDGVLYFVEINARKQGTTLQTALTMSHLLPDHPLFTDLEFMAATDGRLPDGLVELDSCSGPISWETFNLKAEQDMVMESSLEGQMTEAELFERAAAGGSGYTVLDHAGQGTHVLAGSFLGRVIAAGPDGGSVRKALNEGITHLEGTAVPLGGNIS